MHTSSTEDMCPSATPPSYLRSDLVEIKAGPGGSLTVERETAVMVETRQAVASVRF